MSTKFASISAAYVQLEVYHGAGFQTSSLQCSDFRFVNEEYHTPFNHRIFDLSIFPFVTILIFSLFDFHHLTRFPFPLRSLPSPFSSG
ncbi:unnamed protein product [Citrullus colocynthis]|uniref:Uncharacterized protein n=1 Tax=Citrullus colocynthis TaxID=252529 RepID=A0ABP0YLU7_9ROSI